MKNSCIFLVLLAFACSPKNDEVTEEQIDIAPQAEALDSVADTEKDAVIINETDEDTALPLPQPVLQLLAQKYPGYRQPTLAESTNKPEEDSRTSSYLVSGNFTNDTRLDYALQLQQDKSLYIVAVTDTGDGNWSVHELKRDVMFNERGTLKSLYYLQVAEPGNTVQEEENGARYELKNEAVSVGLENNLTTYVYMGKSFKPYTPLKQP